MADLETMTVTPCGGSGGEDFLSLYMSKTQTPSHKMNGSMCELQFSPSPSKSPHDVTADDPHAFCRLSNLQECIAHLNQEVTMLSMPSLYDGKSCTYDIVRIVNCTHELLQRHQRSTRVREDLESRLHRLEADEANLRLLTNRLKLNIDQCQRELAAEQECERQLLNKNKLLSTKLKVEKEEVRRLQSEVLQRGSQHKHELRKKEREMLKMRERLNQLLTDKCQEKKSVIEISEYIHRTDGKRALWQKGNKHEEDMYRTVISNYEDQQKELLVENSGLRQLLNEMEKELVAIIQNPDTGNKEDPLEDVFEQTDGDESIGSIQSSPTEELPDGYFQMPYAMMKDGLEKSLLNKCKAIKMHLKQAARDRESTRLSECLPSPRNEEKDEEEIERLRKQIERYSEIVEQQENLIQQSLAVQEECVDNSLLDESNLWEERDVLASEREIITQQKAKLREDSENFTEAAIRLIEERKVFENERANFLKQQILQLTPFQGGRTKSSKVMGSHVKRQRLKDPVMARLMTPANIRTPGLRLHGVETPSTADLYRTLGITSQTGQNETPQDFHASPALKGKSGRQLGLASTPCLSPGFKVSTMQKTGCSARISEHMENVKIALFNRDKRTGSNGQEETADPTSPEN